LSFIDSAGFDVKVYRRLFKSVVILLFAPFICSVQALEWQMPLAGDQQSFQSQLAFDFAREVQRNTNNKLLISTFPAGELFQGEQIFGAVKNGLVPIGVRLISALDYEHPLLRLDALPFLAKNYMEAFNLYKASKGDLEKVLKVKGVKLLYAVPWPAQGLYSTKKINSMDDFKNLRFRPYSKVTAIFGKNLGLKPVIIPLTKLNRALRRKHINVLFGSALAAQKLPLAKYFPYWYDLQAWLPKEMAVVSLQHWQKLTAVEQKALTAAAQTVEVRGWAKSKQLGEQGKQALLAAGVKIETLSPEVLRSIEVVGLSIVQQWLEEIGDKGRNLLERYIKK